MNHILEATDFHDTGLHEPDAAAAPRFRRRIPWERAIRCLLLTAIIAMVGYLAWRPALLRFSQLMFMVSPSHGDSLAWKPDFEEPPIRLSPRRETPAPAEWRLTMGMHGAWRAERLGLDNHSLWRGPSQIPAQWQRLSTNPWNWQDDAAPAKAARRDAESPTQKPATDFRAKAADAWGASVVAAPAREQNVVDNADTPAPASYPARQIPSLAPLPGVETASRPAEEPQPAAAVDAGLTEELPPLGIPELPSRNDRPVLPEPVAPLETAVVPERPAVAESAPVARPESTGSLRPTSPANDAASLWEQVAPTSAPHDPQAETPESNTAAQTDWTQFVVPTPQIETTRQEPSLLDQAVPGEVIVSAPVFQTPPSDIPAATRDESPANAPESADWKNQEITGPIPGAYLTIYPRLKFIGLCVPGQGYIRKYNQVAVPRETTGEKVAAADGRTPYGKYYITARNRAAEGPRLVLSWPSPEDARRLDLDAMQTALIENAWLSQSLPPQDTPAGGGIALTGQRERLESTDGGFALEEPHMEEIYTALPDGAWVFIQE